MTIKIDPTRSEILEIKTSYGTVLISFLDHVGLSVGVYTDPESNPVSAVHIRPDGEVIEVHCPKDESLIAYLDELDAEYGAPSPEIVGEVEAEWDAGK